ncbi:MAG: peroxiredoxin [Planctomycetaceae bacterium]|nr:peroxiredoxin [Planctomycetaceae bacterium]
MTAKLNLLAFGLLTMSGFVTAGFASDAVDLKVGDKAPTFAALDDSGKEWKSADHVGEKLIVVYFYPADMTGGCTKQACGFRDDLGKLTDKGVEVVGVSGDSVRNHQLFKQAHDLNFALLADTDGKVAEAFGVPIVKGEKSVPAKINGKDEVLVRTVTAKRWTFVIGKDGKIAVKTTEVNAAEDSKAILKMVEGLKK